ncbi:hypothetical protein RRG08_005658 [Elysia crispata]|uniref:Uncharacterized protein n=1 Tax=Elysia crispata TaxID=231223 RepID=A0AAE0YCG2_9GAST|nr:hypothetical protein RRG08_005658 [Elysia crispata]
MGKLWIVLTSKQSGSSTYSTFRKCVSEEEQSQGDTLYVSVLGGAGGGGQAGSTKRGQDSHYNSRSGRKASIRARFML